jgi:hypothetical protein
MFLTQKGPVLGAAEMLSPVSWTQQPFRFVALAYGDQRRLLALTGCPPKPEVSTPEQIGLIGSIPNAEPEWIDKYRAAISQDPPRRPLFERMLEAITPSTK